MTRTNPKAAHCDRCKSDNVAWFKSKRTGHYYLCEVFTDEEGDRVSSSRDFHSKYCGKPEAHAEAQAAMLRRKYDAPTPAPLDKSKEEAAEEMALAISNHDTFQRVILIADLSREDRELARMVADLWLKQGETTLALMLDGALTGRAD